MFIVLGLQAIEARRSLAQDVSECIERDTDILPYEQLPESLRIIQHDVEQSRLEVINVGTGISDTLIDNFDNQTRVVLLDDGQHLLIIQDNQWEKVNIETLESHSISQVEVQDILGQQPQIGAILEVPYIDGEYFDYSVITGFPAPDLKNPIIYSNLDSSEYFARIKYASNRKYVAYRAYSDKSKQTEDIVIRIEDIETHHYVDIDLSKWGNRFDFFWNTSSEQIYIQNQSQFVAYDANTGEIILESQTIHDKLENVFKPVSILQSHNNSRLLVSYYAPGIYRDVKLFFYDLLNQSLLPFCLDVNVGARSATGLLMGEYVWSPDDRYIWWLGSPTYTSPNLVNLMIFDTETQFYGIVASNVGYLSRISFVEG